MVLNMRALLVALALYGGAKAEEDDTAAPTGVPVPAPTAAPSMAPTRTCMQLCKEMSCFELGKETYGEDNEGCCSRGERWGNSLPEGAKAWGAANPPAWGHPIDDGYTEPAALGWDSGAGEDEKMGGEKYPGKLGTAEHISWELCHSCPAHPSKEATDNYKCYPGAYCFEDAESESCIIPLYMKDGASTSQLAGGAAVALIAAVAMFA